MKVIEFEAQNVHGFLPLRIQFLPDLTFLTGLNGSGKTTALRLLMGLLTPNLAELIDVKFTSATVRVADASGHEILVQAKRSPDYLSLSTSDVEGELRLTAEEIHLLADSDERRSPIHAKVQADPIFRAIANMSTPMFLGLDRKIYVDRASWLPRFQHEVRHSVGTSIAGSTVAVLKEVSQLVGSALSESRISQEKLDETLRNQILLDIFRYEAADASTSTFPNRKELERFRERQAFVENAASGLGLPVGQLQTALSEFFDKMTSVVNAVEKMSEELVPAMSSPKALKSDGSQAKQSRSKKESFDPVLLEWVMNGRQAERIYKCVELFEQYGSDRTKLYERIDRFLELTNRFLKETKKAVKVLAPDRLMVVSLDGNSQPRPLTALSSGERQLVVMLAHLSLNKRLSGSAIFIVDEPELSLHISWQERFVDAIQEANPKVQLIMATHSPAIVLGKLDNCVSLS